MRRTAGAWIHRLSDVLHVWAHWLHGDPDWRIRNGDAEGDE